MFALTSAIRAARVALPSARFYSAVRGLKIVAADDTYPVKRADGGEALMNKALGDGTVEVRSKYTEDELIKAIPNMDALIVRSATTVTRKCIEAAASTGRLKVIGRAGAGVDNIDTAAATEKGIYVMNTPFGNTISAAEMAVSLLFATARNIARADATMQAGKWDKKNLQGNEVFGKTLGVVGLGKIGAHVAKVMAGAGMKIQFYDPATGTDKLGGLDAEKVDLDTLFRTSDFITLHVPGGDATKNLINKESLAKMKKGVRIVNNSRGTVIDDRALAEAVRSGHVAAAGIDVFFKEPYPGGPLVGVKNITMTPHLGASTEEAEERVGFQIAEQFVDFFGKNIVRNAVNGSKIKKN